MYSNPTGDENLFNFPLTKSAFDPNEIPFVGSLPESLRVFREALGYELRFVRAGSSELASPRGDLAQVRGRSSPGRLGRRVSARLVFSLEFVGKLPLAVRYRSLRRGAGGRGDQIYSAEFLSAFLVLDSSSRRFARRGVRAWRF